MTLKSMRNKLRRMRKNKNAVSKLSAGRDPFTTRNRNAIAEMVAMIKFANGPASAIKTESHFGFFRLYGLNGTGFAQPNPKSKSGMNPNRSKCASGLSVNRPSRSAVGSPRNFAMSPCENSCAESEKRIAMIQARARGREENNNVRNIIFYMRHPELAEGSSGESNSHRDPSASVVTDHQPSFRMTQFLFAFNIRTDSF